MTAEAGLLSCCCQPEQNDSCQPPVTSFVAMVGNVTLDFDYVTTFGDGNTPIRFCTGYSRNAGNNTREILRTSLSLSSEYVNKPILMQSPTGTSAWCGYIPRQGSSSAYDGFIGQAPSGQGWSGSGVLQITGSGAVVGQNTINTTTSSIVNRSLQAPSFGMYFKIQRFRFLKELPSTYHPWYYEFAILCSGGVVPLIMRLGSTGCPTGPWGVGNINSAETKLRGLIRFGVSAQNCSPLAAPFIFYPTQFSDTPMYAVSQPYSVTTMI
jgi:hypothetical protein